MKARNVVKVLSFNTFIPFFYPALMLPLKSYRRKAIAMMNFKPEDRVLIPGVGSGHDLPFLPADVTVEGVDISDVMLNIAEAKLRIGKHSENVHLREMDAENLEYPDNSFDKAILSLLLTVVFDPKKAFSEAVRVVRPGGEILIFDHLLKRGEVPKAVTKPIDAILSYSFASITRVFEDIVEGSPVSLIKEMPGDPVGFVKGFLLRKD
jgi:ubiquinone/menaquinone biosynthesis C-methylase UbiE